MKHYQELMIQNTGYAGEPPGVAGKLTAAAANGWRFVAMLPVPGNYVCALLERDAPAPEPMVEPVKLNKRRK
jgi:hypothetical protein